MILTKGIISCVAVISNWDVRWTTLASLVLGLVTTFGALISDMSGTLKVLYNRMNCVVPLEVLVASEFVTRSARPVRKFID